MVLQYVTRRSQIRIYLKPLHSNPGQFSHAQLSVRKAMGAS